MTDEEFLTRYNNIKPALYNVCTSFGKKFGRDTIEEYMQIVMVKLWVSKGHYHYDDNYKAWACMVARNTLINFVRREARYNEIFNEELCHLDIYKPSQSPDPEEALLKKQIHREVMEHLSDLIPEYRDVLIMADLRGMAYSEIAESLDIPIGTVMSRLYRARRALGINPRDNNQPTELGG